MVDWDAKYGAVDTLLYGDNPSDIVHKASSEYATKLGNILCLGDGEGRQSRALAKLGFSVTAIDISSIATARARQRDEEHGIKVDRLICDAAKPPPMQLELNSCFICYLHFSVAERQSCFYWLRQILPTGGLLFIEGFGPEQAAYNAKYNSGGPGQKELLYDTKILRNELFGFIIHHNICAETELDDGPGHQGLANITQMVLEKK
tara:strand:+ start:532 stop:1146 length:615 start_codon:yes stop_codon:yes gene_type:complete